MARTKRASGTLVQPATGNTARGRGAVAASRDAVQFIWGVHESRVAMSGAKALAAAASLTQCATASFAFQVQGHQSARQLFQDCGRHCCRGFCPSIDTLPKTCHSQRASHRQRRSGCNIGGTALLWCCSLAPAWAQSSNCWRYVTRKAAGKSTTGQECC